MEMIDKKKIRNLLNRAEMPYLAHEIIKEFVILIEIQDTENKVFLSDVLGIVNLLKEKYKIEKTPKKEKVIQTDLENLILEIKKEKDNDNI